MIQHPLRDLTVSDAKIYFRHADGELGAEYLGGPAIEIAEKGESVPRADGSLVTYEFFLNARPDLAWQALLAHELENMSSAEKGAAGVAVVENRLELTCRAPDLAGRYASVKAAVARTNEAYVEEQKKLVDFIAAKKLKAEASRRGDAKRTVGGAFEGLAL